jgi:hypothetical protein
LVGTAHRRLDYRPGAEGMADKDRSAEAGRGDQRADPLGLVGPRISAVHAALREAERRQIDRDGAVPFVAERLGHTEPKAAPGGRAVHQQHRRAVSGTARLNKNAALGGLNELSIRRRSVRALAPRRSRTESGSDDNHQQQPCEQRLRRPA